MAQVKMFRARSEGEILDDEDLDKISAVLSKFLADKKFVDLSQLIVRTSPPYSHTLVFTTLVYEDEPDRIKDRYG